MLQGPGRYRSSSNCCDWLPECWQIFAHRSDIRDHLASCQWDLYPVRNSLWHFNTILTSLDPTSSCPTECRLSRSDSPWKCTVSLRFVTDSQGQLLGQVRNEVFGSTIYDQSEVEERIRRAQRAILNPKKPLREFLENEDDDVLISELNFSTNCVSLQISGPEVADLSFCDLPGTSYTFFPCLITFPKTHQV